MKTSDTFNCRVITLAILLSSWFGNGPALAASCPPPSFAGPLAFPPGGYFNGLSVGDFNGDGKADLAFGNAVLLGKGDGTFQAPITLSGGGGAPLVSDFNGDGKPDLAVAGGASVLLGKGDGTFQAAINVTGRSGSPVVGDFNGDGNADLAVASGTVLSVLFGRGDGTFQAAIEYAFGGLASLSLAADDFNGDGKPDLAVVRVLNLTAGDFAMLLNKGDGTFQPPVTFFVGHVPKTLTAADLNSDGRTDVVGTILGGVLVLLGRGDGTFQAPFTSPVTANSVLSRQILIGTASSIYSRAADVALRCCWATAMAHFRPPLP